MENIDSLIQLAEERENEFEIQVAANLNTSSYSYWKGILDECKHWLSKLKDLKQSLPQAGAGNQDGWISVDNKPEIGEYVLVNIETDTVLKGRLMNNGWTAFFADGEKLVGDIRPVTHWQPLPPPPKGIEP